MFDNVYAPKAKRNSFDPRAPRTIYPLGSKSKRQRELTTRADAFTLIGLGHEIQWEALEFSEEHKCLSDLNQFKGRWNSADKQGKHWAQQYSQKDFPYTNSHHVPWIYCNVILVILTAPWNVGYILNCSILLM